MTSTPTIRGTRLARALRLATPQQLWRLNQQGALVMAIPSSALEPGAEPAHDPIGNAEADAALKQYQEQRWRGLDHWPKAGESWRVVDGQVVSLGVENEGART